MEEKKKRIFSGIQPSGERKKQFRQGIMERHHIFEGVANRKKSEEFRLVVLLCGEECHRNGREAAHRCGETALRLHRWGQRKFMAEQNATEEDFRRVFGKSYL